MKVFNLRCFNEHHFEGWFASSDEFDLQLRTGLLSCPACDNAVITRLPSAPRLNLHAGIEPPVPPEKSADQTEKMQGFWGHAIRTLLANTEEVGDRFAEEARKIHYGETPERGIRGVATRKEHDELREEGIDVLSIPISPGMKEPLQ